MVLDLIISGVLFVIMFFVLFIYNIRKIKKSNYNKILFIGYFIGKFKLDKKKVKYKELSFFVCLINAFIIAFVSLIAMLVPTDKVWQYLIAFVLLFALVYSIYEIYGRYLIKKGWQKDNV